MAVAGCERSLRDHLERRAGALGVRVVDSVSARTALLVTDGSSDGEKARKAVELDVRHVHPADFALLLDVLQPSTERGTTPPATTSTPPGPPPAAVVTPEFDAPLAPPSPADVRTWARANGFKVGNRGRLPRQLSDAYTRARRSGVAR